MADPDREIWDGMLTHVRRHHPTLCRHWFSELEHAGIDDGSVYVRADSEVRRDYLRRDCVQAFVEAAQNETESLIGVRFLGPGEHAPTHAPGREAGQEHGQAGSVVESKPHDGRGESGHGETVHAEIGVSGPAASGAAISGSVNQGHVGSRGAESSLRMPPPLPTTRRPIRYSSSESASESSGTIYLNPDYVFDNFIIGEGNRWAYAASVAVAENPGRSYNPLFIHGDVGLGKTHLLQAICLRIMEARPGSVMHYISCDGFINDFMHAVQANEMEQFRHRFRDVDVLVIDDIHFLTSRERSQEEFFHTFNSLHGQQKQIILSSDAPPQQIPQLEKRLASRFQSGLVTEIMRPTFETRVAILFTKARLRGIELGQGVAEYVAERFETNIRELEGAITRLQIQATVENRPIDLPLAHEAFGEEPDEDRPRPTIDAILDVVCRYYDVKRGDLLGKRRHQSISLPRQVGMFLAREHTRLSLEEIGAQFGGRDHTTVIHAVKSIKAKQTESKKFTGTVQKLAGQLVRAPGRN